jgi:hypothetical protein
LRLTLGGHADGAGAQAIVNLDDEGGGGGGSGGGGGGGGGGAGAFRWTLPETLAFVRGIERVGAASGWASDTSNLSGPCMHGTQFGQQWKMIATEYATELRRVCGPHGDIHRLPLRYRGLSRKDGILPSQEELLLAMAENVDETTLMHWIVKRRAVRGWARLCTAAAVGMAPHPCTMTQLADGLTDPQLDPRAVSHGPTPAAGARGAVVQCTFPTCPNTCVVPSRRHIGSVLARTNGQAPPNRLFVSTEAYLTHLRYASHGRFCDDGWLSLADLAHPQRGALVECGQPGGPATDGRHVRVCVFSLLRNATCSLTIPVHTARPSAPSVRTRPSRCPQPTSTRTRWATAAPVCMVWPGVPHRGHSLRAFDVVTR